MQSPLGGVEPACTSVLWGNGRIIGSINTSSTYYAVGKEWGLALKRANSRWRVAMACSFCCSSAVPPSQMDLQDGGAGFDGVHGFASTIGCDTVSS